MFIVGYLLIIIGVVQLLSLIIRLSLSKGKNPEYRKNLISYFKLVVFYFIILTGLIVFEPKGDTAQAVLLIYLTVIPMIMVCYYTWIIYKPYKKPIRKTITDHLV